MILISIYVSMNKISLILIQFEILKHIETNTKLDKVKDL